MKIILLLLSISPFFLEKSNPYADPSGIKYGQWRPNYQSDDSPGLIYAGAPHKCIDCVKGPEVFPVGPFKYRPKFPRYRRPAKHIRRFPDRYPESPDGQANQIPGRVFIEITGQKKHDPYPNRQVVVIPEKPSSGSGSGISVPCVEKPKKCPFKGPKRWNDPINPGSDSLPNILGSCECGKTDYAMMIVQGREVDPPFKYPWMVALQRGDGLTFCGGAIVSNQYILTAAHCLAKGTLGFYSPREIKVAFVTNEYVVSEGEDVADVIVHPEYEYLNKDHDIGLLKLKNGIQCSEERRPICLPAHGMKVHPGEEFIIAGWGSREGGTPDVSPFLMETGIKAVDFGKCSEQFSNLKENFHCLQGIEDSSPCHGDSGGPMFTEHQNKFYVFGVASMHNSRECDTSDVFVYTKVTNYVDWIKSEIHQF